MEIPVASHVASWRRRVSKECLPCAVGLLCVAMSSCSSLPPGEPFDICDDLVARISGCAEDSANYKEPLGFKCFQAGEKGGVRMIPIIPYPSDCDTTFTSGACCVSCDAFNQSCHGHDGEKPYSCLIHKGVCNRDTGLFEIDESLGTCQ